MIQTTDGSSTFRMRPKQTNIAACCRLTTVCIHSTPPTWLISIRIFLFCTNDTKLAMPGAATILTFDVI